MKTVRHAKVAVVQTASERDHNSDAGKESFQELPLPWVDFEFFDENTVSAFTRGISEYEFSAIVFASNSLYNRTIHEAARAAGSDIAKASAVGMGVVVLQQFLPPDVVRDCEFLPTPHEVEYRGVEGIPIERISIRKRAVAVGSSDLLTLDPSRYGTRSPTLWCEIKPLHEAEWQIIGRVISAGREIPVLLRSRTPRARTIVCGLPLDWIADTSLLAYLVARAVRGRGTLYLHPQDEEVAADVAIHLSLGRSILRGGHLSQQVIGHPSQVNVRDTPYRHFSHFILSPQWSWFDLAELRSESIKERLENGGSVTAHAGRFTDGQPMLVTVGGRPPYLELAHRFAEFFGKHETQFYDAPTTVVRALAVAVAAINSAIADRDAVPRALSLGEMREFVKPYGEGRRQGQDHVDGHVLPTAALASAMELLEFQASDVRALREWIEAGVYASSIASLKQAQLWLPGIQVPERGDAPCRAIDRLYDDLLRLRADVDEPEIIVELCRHLQDENVGISTRAILADSLTYSCNIKTLASVAQSARTLQSDLEPLLLVDNPPLEVVSLLTATLIRIHASGGLVSVPPPDAFD